jgi:hypothetical protein
VIAASIVASLLVGVGLAVGGVPGLVIAGVGFVVGMGVVVRIVWLARRYGGAK